MYKPEDIELPSNFKDAENLLNHEFIGQQLRDDRFVHLLPQMVDEDAARKFIALTYGSIAMIDDGVGKILDSLERLGLADNTMIIFTSDHGDLAGDHGLILKGPAHYRSVINMPLLWNIPGKTEKSVSDSLVSTIDLPMTILSLLGIKEENYPEAFQGYDITSILQDPGKRVRERILIEHDEEIAFDKVMRLRTLVSESHRLTIYDGYDNMGDIFDYIEDPGEVNNLWDRDVDLRHRLTEELLREIVGLQLRIPERKAYN